MQAVGWKTGKAAGQQAFGLEQGEQGAERQAERVEQQELGEAERKFSHRRMREICKAGRRAFQ